jgi:hypothetical protein
MNISAWWLQHREAALNCLALGLLLAAWNASDSGLEPTRHADVTTNRDPDVRRDDMRRT